MPLGMPAPEATKLLNQHQWRQGDVALLEGAAVRLGCWRQARNAPARAKRRFSELLGDAACNQEYASGLKQRRRDEVEPVVA